MDLTFAESELLELISMGYSNKVMAYIMKHSESTVEVYRGRLLKKLGAKNAPHAVHIAHQLKLIK